MPNLPDAKSLEALRAYDTPTICNALEIVAPARRTIGFTRRPLIACFPEMKPVVAFARTALIRSREAHPRDRDSANRIRLGYYEHIAAEPLPSLSVIQDIDAPDTGFGAFWGEVQTHVHKGLGCAGVVTDGSVRDLEAMAPDFLVLAGSVMPSHAHVHLVDYGGTVSVAGMTVTSGRTTSTALGTSTLAGLAIHHFGQLMRGGHQGLGGAIDLLQVLGLQLLFQTSTCF